MLGTEFRRAEPAAGVHRHFHDFRGVAALTANIVGTSYYVAEVREDRRYATVLGQSPGRTNTTAEQATRDLIEKFRPHFLILILIGIAGRIEEDSLGDVILADVIEYYEYMKLVGGEELTRGEPHDQPSEHLRVDFARPVIVLANPVQPRSEGEIVLESANAAAHPTIRMNYFGDPHDMKVMLAVIRRCLDVVAHWPGHRTIGPLLIPPFLAEKHGHVEGRVPSDALLEDYARHYAFTVYHVTTTCRIGSVVDPRLRVMVVERLRVADASVMPNVVSGNTNAASIMIGEKAAEMLAADHGVALEAFVGEPRRRETSSPRS